MKIGIVLPMIENAAIGRPLSWTMLRDLARQAEQEGLDSVWVIDHLIFNYEAKEPQGVHEAMTLLSALAAATERVELGSLVLCTAFRNPAVLAKMAVTLDEISGGRVILGLGAGWHKPEFDAFGFDFGHLVDRFEEAIQIIKPLVQDGAVDFQGNYYQANQCQILPPPSRPIPVLIASYKERMLGLTARHADQWNTAWLGEVAALDPARQAINAACEKEGRDPATLAVTVGVRVEFTDAPAVDIDREKLISGTPSYVADQLDLYAAAGVAHLIVSLPGGVSAQSLATLTSAVRLMKLKKSHR